MNRLEKLYQLPGIIILNIKTNLIVPTSNSPKIYKIYAKLKSSKAKEILEPKIYPLGLLHCKERDNQCDLIQEKLYHRLALTLIIIFNREPSIRRALSIARIKLYNNTWIRNNKL